MEEMYTRDIMEMLRSKMVPLEILEIIYGLLRRCRESREQQDTNEE